MFEQKICHT